MKLLKASEYMTRDNRDPEVKHSEEAERFTREADECDASVVALEAQIRALDYAYENGDPQAQEDVARLEAEQDRFRKTAVRKRGAADKAQELAAKAVRARQEKQHDDKIEKLQADNAAALKAVKRFQKNVRQFGPILAKDIADITTPITKIREAWPIGRWNHNANIDRFGKCLLYPTWIDVLIQAEIAHALHKGGVKNLVKWPSKWPGKEYAPPCPSCQARVQLKTSIEAPQRFIEADLVDPDNYPGIAEHFENANRLIKKALAMATLDGEMSNPIPEIIETPAVEGESVMEKPKAETTPTPEEIADNEKRGNPAGWPLSGGEFAQPQSTAASDDVFGPQE